MASDKKALTSGGGTSFHIGDEEDMAIPSAGAKTAFFSGWMTRLGGGTARRGSVGFNEQGDLPPNRLFDDESLSNSGPSSSADLKAMGLPISSRERKISYSEWAGMTPGDEHDTYFYKSKFKKTDSDSNLQDAMTSNLSMSDNLFKLELASSKSSSETPNIGHGLSLQTVTEGKVLESENEKRAFGEIAELSPKKKPVDGDDKNRSDDKIFLIDLEEMKSENGKTVFKPTTKKVSLGSMLQNKMTNNWFFRNKDAEEEESNLVNHEDKSSSRETTPEAESKSRKSSSTKKQEEESAKEDGPILSKLKNFVDKNKSKHREMNFWQPQGS